MVEVDARRAQIHRSDQAHMTRDFGSFELVLPHAAPHWQVSLQFLLEDFEGLRSGLDFVFGLRPMGLRSTPVTTVTQA